MNLKMIATTKNHRVSLAKHCPRNPLAVANRRVDVQNKYIKSRHGTSIDTPELKPSNQCVTGQ